MTRDAPQPGCFDIDLKAGFALDDPAEVALEDYARAVMRARHAEAVRRQDDPTRVVAVHVCGAPEPPAEAAAADLVDFARDLAGRGGGAGLGWS